MFRKTLFSSIFIFLFMTMKPNAAPPPSEIEKAKQEAPLHVIGKVTSDQLYKDITEEKEIPVQIRKMTLDVKQILKAPTNETLTTVDIFYTYIPSWQAYSGAKRMDIAVGDVIEIWLEKGEYGWEPALSGNTVKHLKYVENRKEPIPEPFWHSIKRNVRTVWLIHSSVTVLVGILAFLFTFVLLAWRKQKTNHL
ncbi:hypothetical protein H839_06374 [Parageobacillus genomosp. 1]|uniref:Uncharacterized protein n=1 Tax=Parageobacillus genomosp. 1 TaxID=1295642 RepID=A0ABC9VFD9_9BACL|nr:hypothetical protein H839_06374 [Parageobacillus genomosp. 1]